MATPLLRVLMLLSLLGLLIPARAALVLPDSGKVSLSAHWALLLDPGMSFDATTLSQPEWVARFEPQHRAPALGYLKGAVWLRITLRRPATAAAEWWLELQSPTLDEAMLYRLQPDGSPLLGIDGNHHARQGQDVSYRNPVFRLELPADTEVSFLIRVRGQNSLSFQLQLWTPDAFVAAIGPEQLAFGVLLAVHLVLILTNLWFFQATRNRMYGLFCLYTLCNFMAAVSTEGYAYRYLLQQLPAVNEMLLTISWMLTTPAVLLFILSALDLLEPPYARWLRLLMLAVLIETVVIGALLLIQVSSWARPFHMLWQLIVSLLLLGLSARVALRKNKTAVLILVSMTPYLIGVGIRFMRNAGLIAPGPFNDSAYYIGMVFYLLVLNYALSRHYQTMRMEKEEAQALALQVSRQTERELEARVNSRTRELHESMDQVQAALDTERRAQAEQREFFATVSHELRTPLAIIDATAQNLELDASAVDEATRRRYEKILRATRRMSMLLENYLDERRFSQLNSGVKRVPCDPVALMQDAVDAARALDGSHAFRIETGSLPRQLMCDPDLTRLALRSLADNAVKYAPPGSTIVLRAQRVGQHDEDGAHFQVIDPGPRLERNDADRVFEAGFRGRNALGKPGSGMGLPLARRMVEVQGGTLTLDVRIDTGNCFTLWLPDVACSPDPREQADEDHRRRGQ